MKKLMTVGTLAITAALLVAASNFGLQNATAAGTAAATTAGTAAATKAATAAPIPTISALATADANLAVAGSGKVTGPLAGEAQALNASGATFPLNLYLNWAKTYKDLTGVAVNYTGGGSGKGRNDIIANAVDFSGSDFPMSDAEIAKAQANGDILHIPSTLGGIVAVYNVAEAKDPLKLTGDVLAQIFDGDIKTWDDPKLLADNPELKGVSRPIKTVYRSDSSGTTQNFTYYLVSQNDKFKTTVKTGSTVNWPVGTGAQGNPGVAQQVKSTKDSIGYVELSYVGTLPYAQLKNGAGNWITANADSISKGAVGVTLAPDLRTVIIGMSTDKDAYPISVFTWILVYTNQSDAAKGTAIARFLWWITHDGQKYNASLGYAPLPQAAIALDEAQILKINSGGKQSLPTDVATPSAAMMAGTMAATAAK